MGLGSFGCCCDAPPPGDTFCDTQFPINIVGPGYGNPVDQWVDNDNLIQGSDLVKTSVNVFASRVDSRLLSLPHSVETGDYVLSGAADVIYNRVIADNASTILVQITAFPFDVRFTPYGNLGGGVFGSEMRIIWQGGSGNNGNFTVGHGTTAGATYSMTWEVSILGPTTPPNPSADYRCTFSVAGPGITWTYMTDRTFNLGGNRCFRGEATQINGTLAQSNLVVTNFTNVAA